MREEYYMGVPISLIAEISTLSIAEINEFIVRAREAAERKEYERLKEKYESRTY